MSASESIAQKVHNLSSLLARESDQILQERLGIGLSQYKILAAVDASSRLQQRAIAVELGQTEASVSRQVKLLLKKDMITSRANPRNRREHLTELTPKGERVAEAAKQSLATYHSAVMSHISKRQQEILLELLDELK
ncbi:MAG TPA: MarR family transcriptional regulator [Patescibacteria group bacterium]|nr:MarR family transcriptional regulator [Patescibacteria group bacterium]